MTILSLPIRLHRSVLVSLLLACLAWKAQAQSAASAVTVHTPDVDLRVDVLGSNTTLPPVILVNGGPGLTHAYMVQNDVWTRFAAHRRVVFYDQRGNGHSVLLKPGAPQTMEAQVQDLEAIRTHLHAERIDLLGDSFGGFIALAYTLAHPDHVRRLVVSDGLPGRKAIEHPMPQIFPDIDAETEAKLKTMPRGPQADEYSLRAHLRKCFYSPELAAKYLDQMKDTGFNGAVSEQVDTATRTLDLTPELGNISVPTLILTGRFDVNVAPLTAWRMQKAIPGARLHIFEHSGHLPSYEEPEAYLKEVSVFFDDAGGNGSTR